MTTKNAGAFIISNNEYFIRDGVGDCYQGLSEKSTKISIDDMDDKKIVYNITERYCDLRHWDECEGNNAEYGTDIDTKFTIVKDNNEWKVEDFTDSYTKYLGH